MTFTLFIEGFSLGLALGTTCLVTCGPAFMPVMMQQERSMSEGIRAVLLLSAGRFITYALFGALSGLLGTWFLQYVQGTRYIIALSYALVATYLLYSGVVFGRKEKGHCPASLFVRFAGRPLLLGMFTGISICPPFLGAMTRSFGRGGIGGGILLFTGFFFGTTLYLLPLSIISRFSKKRLFRVIGAFFSILTGLWFLFLAVDAVFPLRYRIEMALDNAKILDYSETPVTIINLTGNDTATARITDIVTTERAISASRNTIRTILETLKPHTPVLIMFHSNPADNLEEFVRERKLYVTWFNAGEKPVENAAKAATYLRDFAFKARRERGFLYRIPISSTSD